MGRFYSKDFEPIVLPRENLILFYNGSEYYFEVIRLQAVPPFIRSYNGTLIPGATGQITLNDLEPSEFDRIYHFRLEPMDDIHFTVNSPPTSSLWAVKNNIIWVGSPNTEHQGLHTVSTANSPEKVYAVGSGRSALIQKLVITNPSTAAAKVFLCDSGGNPISPTFIVPASTTMVIEAEQLPEEEVSEDIYVESDKAGVIVAVQVKEIDQGYMPRFTDIFMMKTIVPVIQVKNPRAVDISNPRLRFYGYIYFVRPLETRPTQYTMISASH